MVERCSCRSTVNNIPRGHIRELKFIHTPNCPFQVMWVLFWMWLSVGETGFLHIRHFSPSISERGQDREKSCACMSTHTPLCHLLSHTSTESRTCAHIFTSGPLMLSQECEREVETGCNFVLNRKSNNCGFSNWICFLFACHATFPFHTTLTTFLAWSRWALRLMSSTFSDESMQQHKNNTTGQNTKEYLRNN